MLATIGLLFAGICFITFAITYQMWVSPFLKHASGHLAAAYGILGLTLTAWGFMANTNSYYLATSVIAGETLIAIATLCLVDYLIIDRWRTLASVGGVIAAVILIGARIALLYPTPYMSNGVLIFNIPTPVVLVLGLLTLGIWLPASIKAAHDLTENLQVPELRSTYTSIYFATAIAALIFTGSRRPLTAVLSFTALALMAILLIGSNYMVKVMRGHHEHRAN